MIRQKHYIKNYDLPSFTLMAFRMCKKLAVYRYQVLANRGTHKKRKAVIHEFSPYC
jgi:hypothetical protein